MDEDRLVEPLDIEIAKGVIEKRLPQLLVESIEYLGGGSYSVFAINNKIIFRFPKFEDFAAQVAFDLEGKLLDLIRPEVVPHEIPTQIYRMIDSDEIFSGPVYGYKLLDGNRVGDSNLDLKKQLPRLLGDFLTKLHGIDLEPIYEVGFEPVTAEAIQKGWHDSYSDAIKSLFPLLSEEERRWVDNLYVSYLSDIGSILPPVVLTHGDLGDENVLIPNELDRLRVIDFEDAGPYDPGIDFCMWWATFGDDFLNEMIDNYDLDTGEGFLRRVAFYYNRIPMIFFKFGIENRNDKFIRYGRHLLIGRMENMGLK